MNASKKTINNPVSLRKGIFQLKFTPNCGNFLFNIHFVERFIIIKIINAKIDHLMFFLLTHNVVVRRLFVFNFFRLLILLFVSYNFR